MCNNFHTKRKEEQKTIKETKKTHTHIRTQNHVMIMMIKAGELKENTYYIQELVRKKNKADLSQKNWKFESFY